MGLCVLACGSCKVATVRGNGLSLCHRYALPAITNRLVRKADGSILFTCPSHSSRTEITKVAEKKARVGQQKQKAVNK